MKNLILAFFVYIAFGLGSPPEMPVTGGMLVISIFDREPKVENRVTSNSVYLFSVDL